MTGLRHRSGADVSPAAIVSFLLCAVFALIGCGQSTTAAASPIPTIVLSVPQASMRAGDVQTLSAILAGSTPIGGSWVVVGGPLYGTVDPNGVYQAPAIVPPSGNVVVEYLYKKSVVTTALHILNPVPSVASVAPNVLTGTSIPVIISGSNFVRGSQITVNGGSIATTYMDAGHLMGTVALPANASGTVQMAVSTPDPGAVLSNCIAVLSSGVGVQLADPQGQPLLPTATLHTPSYFMEQSDEFVGPFASWTNVKTGFGAIGNGVVDDTSALQNAINSITDASASTVLWIPAGTYKITKTLVFGHMANFSVIGEDPGTTTLKWAGPQGGTMVLADGSTSFKIARLGFDGSSTATIAEDLTKVTVYPNAYYSTFNELSDQHIRGVAVGIHLGIDAETTVERVFFDNLATAGLAVGDFNTLNIFVNDSLFLNCGTGLTNVYQNGSGSFIVSNSYFVNSQFADMSIANTGLFTARHNTSIGSNTFFYSYEIYNNNSTITLQNNTIVDPTTTPFQFGNLGPFMLIDNVVRLKNASIPMIEASWSPSSLKDVFSMGNVYTPNGGVGTGDIAFQGRVVSYDDTVVPVSSITDVAVPTNVYVPPNFHRAIFDVGLKMGSAVQTAINLAAASGTQRPVVHLTKGVYPVSSTIALPSGSDIQIIGDDVGSSILSWSGGSTAGPVLAIPTSNVSLRSLRVEGAGEGKSDGILLKISDEPNMQVILDQAQLQYWNSYGANFDGMEHATAEMFSGYVAGSITGVKVTGGAFRAANEGTLGVTNHYTGSLQSESTGTSFDVSAGGKYMVQDNWHDCGETGPRNFKLSGSGTVTEQGGEVCMNSSTPFEIDSFTGNVTLMGLSVTGGFQLASNVGQTNLLNLGLVGSSATYLPSSTPTVTLQNVLNSYTGDHIAQTTTPDVAFMRTMLAQSRSEYPSARPTLAAGANRIRFNRIMVDSTSSAVHITPDVAKTALYYVLQSGSSSLANTNGACVNTSFANENDQWLVMSAGEGDFEIVSKATGTALGFAASPSQSLALEPITGFYDQRWMINRLGDGNFSLTNRKTGTLLSLPTPEGCVGLATGGSTSWTMTAY